MRFVVVVLLLVACSPDPGAGGDVGCSKDADCKGSRICVLGACEEPTPPDAGLPLGPDAGDPVDAGDVADAGDVDAGDVDAGDVDAGSFDAGPDCLGESFAEACTARGWDCGTPTITDRCGRVRQVDCGTCPGGGECSRERDNVCWCPPDPTPDENYCIFAFYACGDLSTHDRCGRPVTVHCGDCVSWKTCTVDSDGANCR